MMNCIIPHPREVIFALLCGGRDSPAIVVMTQVTICDLWKQRACCFSGNCFHSEPSRSNVSFLLQSKGGTWSGEKWEFIGLIDSTGGRANAVWLRTGNTDCAACHRCYYPPSRLKKPSCSQSALDIVPMVTVCSGVGKCYCCCISGVFSPQIKVFFLCPYVCSVHEWDLFNMRKEHLSGGLVCLIEVCNEEL